VCTKVIRHIRAVLFLNNLCDEYWRKY